MKKYLALLLALCMALALCACGGAAEKDEPAEEPTPTDTEPQLDRNSIDAYLGTWESEMMLLIINRGGVGKYEAKRAAEPGRTFSYSFTYEVKDETLVITIDSSVAKYISSFELNEDGSALIIIQKGLPVFDPALVEGKTAFTKK